MIESYLYGMAPINNSNNASCVPHEMLHNYGCEHTPADQLNIMHPIAGTKTVIRQPQWIKVRRKIFIFVFACFFVEHCLPFQPRKMK